MTASTDANATSVTTSRGSMSSSKSPPKKWQLAVTASDSTDTMIDASCRSANAHAAGVRTDPAEAADYVRRTGVDALAVAVGSSHAMTSRSAALDHVLIARLRDAVPVPLVLHGSSGVPDDELRRAVAAGMVKINVGTALSIAFTGAVRDSLERNRSVVDPRSYLAEARDAMASTVRQLISVLDGKVDDDHQQTGSREEPS